MSMKLPPLETTEHELHVETLSGKRSVTLTPFSVPEVRFATLQVIVIEGHEADNIGGNLLQQLADKEGWPVLVNGRSDFHGTRVFHPAQHALSMERRMAEAEAS